MVKILNFKEGATIIKLNNVVRDLNVWGILMSHCGRDNTEIIHL
jgi:phosphoribosylpyrophosphate synthetase